MNGVKRKRCDLVELRADLISMRIYRAFCSLSAMNKNFKPLKPHVLLFSNRKNANKLKRSIASRKAVGSYFPLALFLVMYKVVLTFESVDKILKCDHSNEIYRAVLSCGAVYYTVQGGSYF